jgi:hypothetical protein
MYSAVRQPLCIVPHRGTQPRKIGIRVTAYPVGYPGPSAQIILSGHITPEEARVLASVLMQRADEVQTRNEREDEKERKRRVRLSSLPVLSWHTP